MISSLTPFYMYSCLACESACSSAQFKLAALIKKSHFVIANDTGPAHMAAHLGVKGIVLFGPHTTPKKVSIEKESIEKLKEEIIKKYMSKIIQHELSQISYQALDVIQISTIEKFKSFFNLEIGNTVVDCLKTPINPSL